MSFMQSFLDIFFLQTITQFLIIICTFTLILFNQPLKCLLGLTGVYILTSILFMHVSSTFLGILYLTVYIGAVVVLFLFVIMIIGDNNVTTRNFNIKKNGVSWNLLTGLIFFVIIYESFEDFIRFVLQSYEDLYLYYANSLNFPITAKNNFIFNSSSAIKLNIFEQFMREPLLSDTLAVSELRLIGLILYGTNQGLLILLVSLVLLVGMLGAIVLTTTELEYRQ